MIESSTDLTELWLKFKSLPTWKQILVFLPGIVIVIAILFISTLGNQDLKSKSKDLFVKRNKAKTDAIIKDSFKRTEVLKQQQEELAKRKQVLKTKMEKDNEQNQEMDKKINNANSSDELFDLHDELCKRARRRKEREGTFK